MSRVKTLDVFRSLPKDLTEPTYCGGLISLICTGVIVVLGVQETTTYIRSSTSSKIVIENTHSRDKFHANLDISFPFIPCDLIGLTIIDGLGNKV